MAAIIYDFSIEQGSYSTTTFVYQNSNGQNIDLTDYCVVLQWTDNLGNFKRFTNREKSNSYDLTTYSDGRIVFNLSAITTNSYNFDSAIYDLDIQEPNEQYSGSGYKTFRLASGTITITKRLNPQPLLNNCIDLPYNRDDNDCPIECVLTDIYSVLYQGEPINIPDSNIGSSTISISDTRQIEKLEVIINGLNHKNPQDLQFILSPPNSNKILLSANQKITNYIPGFNFIFSDDAPSTNYLHTIKQNEKCRIYDKTDSVKFNNDLLEGSFANAQGLSAEGDWTLIIRDTDPGNNTGSISSWGLIITYYPET